MNSVSRDRTKRAPRERRRHIRVAPAEGSPIRLDLNGPGFMEVFSAREISVSGVGIDVSHRFDNCHVEQTVRLLVRLPAPVNANIACSGQIRHISEAHFGILFTNLSAEQSRQLRRYVGARLKAASLWTRLRFALRLI